MINRLGILSGIANVTVDVLVNKPAKYLFRIQFVNVAIRDQDMLTLDVKHVSSQFARSLQQALSDEDRVAACRVIYNEFRLHATILHVGWRSS